MSQKNIFIAGEGDAWYERNKQHTNDNSVNNDPILAALNTIKCKPTRILEIGCANGWRLAQLKKIYSAECYGIDPSILAIQNGQTCYPDLNLFVGTADTLPNIESVDLIIFGFCLYLCDPQDLFKIAANSDHLLSDKGLMTILDFNPPAGHYRNEYQHHNHIFSYKMNYGDMFCWHPSYHRIFEHSRHHNGSNELELEPDSLVSVQIFKKDCQLLTAKNPYLKGYNNIPNT
ncbi:class I SAM-dependent methyltransferase [Aeromonas cavernicola]|uniref:Class I SAM-dependent methyltransferase n=1 Tax=Aeromonas cavernicola TaxID=1006623 RepID=A0A2H9U5L4_9GAMM|nr:class I SAM-dependent methyltransferase [Aeromonas cavernicola]PJG59343.1 class I SAM-dependent methyltransferase [Aeromonas cavernicola]